MTPHCCYCMQANHVGHIWVPCPDCQQERKLSIHTSLAAVNYGAKTGFTSKERALGFIEGCLAREAQTWPDHLGG